MYVCMYVCLYVCISFIKIKTFISMWMSWLRLLDVQASKFTNIIHTYIHTSIHTYIYTCCYYCIQATREQRGSSFLTRFLHVHRHNIAYAFDRVLRHKNDLTRFVGLGQRSKHLQPSHSRQVVDCSYPRFINCISDTINARCICTGNQQFGLSFASSTCDISTALPLGLQDNACGLTTAANDRRLSLTVGV